MSPATRRWLYWMPRVLALLFALFLGLFSLDVLGEGHGFPRVLLALGMHLIPTALVLVALAVAWRWEWVGAALYLGLGILYIVLDRGRFPWSVYAIIAGPLFLVALLFLIGWLRRTEVRPGG